MHLPTAAPPEHSGTFLLDLIVYVVDVNGVVGPDIHPPRRASDAGPHSPSAPQLRNGRRRRAQAGPPLRPAAHARRGAARVAAAILTPLRADSVGFFSPGVKLTETGASSARFSLDSVLIKKYKHV